MLLTIAEGKSGSSANAQVGQTVTLSVTGDGTPPLMFTWMKDGAPIPGASAQTLTFSPVKLSDAGVYSAQVANAAGLTVSDNASLLVSPAMTTLNVNVTSTNFPDFAIISWQRDGKTIAGANTPTYSFDASAAPGAYSCRITWPTVK